MNKKILFFVFSIIIILTSCSNKRTADDAKRKAAPAIPDSTIFAQLDATDGDSIDVTLLDNGQKFRLSIAEAVKNGNVAGDMNIGDTLAIMARDNDHEVSTSVNVSQITGLWFYCGGKGDGMKLTADGAACSIGAEKFTLRAWRIGNGFFILNYIKADGSDYSEIPDTSKIDKLSKDSLVFVFKDRTVKCTRKIGLLTVDK